MLRKNSGFTLVELLIVVAIIGILAAIAIPQFAAYRAKAYCAAAKSDLANLAIAEEAYFTDFSAYLTGGGTGPTSAGGAAAPFVLGASSFTPSKDVTVAATGIVAAGGVAASFTATASHPQCAQGSNNNAVPGQYDWDSNLGGLQP
jgi:prepilin-type N-terminal cleavage/methylation domain-containing protein